MRNHLLENTYADVSSRQKWLGDIRLTEVISIAAIHIVFARLGQIFAIEPSNVTPVWIPSGVLLAVALKYGPSIWPGVFLGAFLGNIWAYFSTESLLDILEAVGSATLNGIGDVICILVAAELIRYFSKNQAILSSHRALLLYLGFGAAFGPLISALFGSTGLWLFGHIAPSAYSEVFVTWLLGDSVGVLIFTPFILSWLYPEQHFDRRAIIALIASTMYSFLLAAIVFEVVHFSWHVDYGAFLFIPLLVAMLFRFGQRLIFTVQVAVLLFSIVATWSGHGPFVTDTSWVSLLQLQSFAAAFSIILFLVAILNLEKSASESYLEKRTLELEELYRKDALTGLWNRYRIKEFLHLELERLKRDETPFAVLLIDIDDFKSVNDLRGHIEGDRVLKELSKLIQNNLREVDFAGRWGGEEFIVIVSNADEHKSLIVSRKLLYAVREHEFGLSRPITVSIGATVGLVDDDELSVTNRADQALYESKHSGKNTASLKALS